MSGHAVRDALVSMLRAMPADERARTLAMSPDEFMADVLAEDALIQADQALLDAHRSLLD